MLENIRSITTRLLFVRYKGDHICTPVEGRRAWNGGPVVGYAAAHSCASSFKTSWVSPFAMVRIQAKRVPSGITIGRSVAKAATLAASCVAIVAPRPPAATVGAGASWAATTP